MLYILLSIRSRHCQAKILTVALSLSGKGSVKKILDPGRAPNQIVVAGDTSHP